MPDWSWLVGLGLLGLVIGSFVATLVIRWPAGRSVIRGRSACDGCGRVLSAWELVPLAAGLVRRGRCATCGAAIDPRHWQIEIGCAAIGVGSALAVQGLPALAGAVFGWLLVALAALDIAAFWLPDRLTATLAGSGVVVGLAGIPPDMTDRLVGGVAGFAILWSIAAGYRWWRGREGLGGGDPKLLGAIGLWLGWRMLPFVPLLASLVGLAAVAAAMARGRRVAATDAMPFGALMAIAAYPLWLVMIGLAP
ncbi:prepilin peptidase [uncultured Sphingomonas sp.]|uniref:prepilin peptidase n=1 Tax=uncultured Sphingomonas sp. TaxID=158754 RepID=UPI0035CB357B